MLFCEVCFHSFNLKYFSFSSLSVKILKLASKEGIDILKLLRIESSVVVVAAAAIVAANYNCVAFGLCACW